MGTSGLQNGLSLYEEQERFFSDHKMNHEATEEFHGLCVRSSVCDPEGYWCQLGTASLLPPRGSVNKTQLLGKIIVRRHQNILHHASILSALKGLYLPQSYKTVSEKKLSSTGYRIEEDSFLPNLLLLQVSLLSATFQLAA